MISKGDNVRYYHGVFNNIYFIISGELVFWGVSIKKLMLTVILYIEYSYLEMMGTMILKIQLKIHK